MKKQFKAEISSAMINVKFITFFLVFIIFSFCLPLSGSFAEEVVSRSVVAMDASNGRILYAKNPHLRRAPASTTKLMTAIVVMENADLDDTVTISRNAAQVSPHKAGFREGDKVTFEKLLYAALLGSANDAAVALAEGVSGSEERFVELMNRKALTIGATNTKFINPNGLPGPGQYITAYDLAKIMGYALRYPKLKEIIGTRVAEISTERGKEIFLRNTNRLLWSEEDLLGGKTGYTRTARHCFVCAAEREKETIIVAVLGSPSRQTLWDESEMLISKGFDVMGNREKPMVYVTNVSDDDTYVKKASSRKYTKSKKGKKLIAKKTVKNGKTKMLAEKKGKKKHLTAKKKGSKKTFAKKKAKKNYRIAKKNGAEKTKG